MRFSCALPSKRALSRKNRTIGECWSHLCAADGANEIFISPLLNDPLVIAATMVHEIAHAVVGCEHGHKTPFKRAATALGLTGKATATVAGPELTVRLNELLATMPAYPHSEFDIKALQKNKQGTRLLKASCPACGYVVRLTAKWAAIGLPVCLCGTEMEQN
jgi:hypothetical protein